MSKCDRCGTRVLEHQSLCTPCLESNYTVEPNTRRPVSRPIETGHEPAEAVVRKALTCDTCQGPLELTMVDGKKGFVCRRCEASKPKPAPERRPFHKKDVVVGAIYLVRVGQRLCKVRLDAVHMQRDYRSDTTKPAGWDGTNLSSGRKVLIKSAAKLRARVS